MTARLANLVPDTQVCYRIWSVQKFLFRQSGYLRLGASRGALAEKQLVVRPFTQGFAQGLERIRLIAITALVDRTQNFQIELIFDFTTGSFDKDNVRIDVIASELQPAGMDVARQFTNHCIVPGALCTHHRHRWKEPAKAHQFLPCNGDARETNEGLQGLNRQRVDTEVAQRHPPAFWLSRANIHFSAIAISTLISDGNSGKCGMPYASEERVCVSKWMILLIAHGPLGTPIAGRGQVIKGILQLLGMRCSNMRAARC